MTLAHRPQPTRRPSASRRLPRWLRRALRTWARVARRWAGPPTRATWVVLEPLLPEVGPAQLDERRCGWFDSSQDLREGLSICEHEAGDAVAAQLPVMAWVQLQLSGWRPTLAAQ